MAWQKFDISLYGYKSAYLLISVLFIVAFWPSVGVEFRAEQWPIYRHYQDLSAPKNIDEFIHIMFWTPFKDYRFLPFGYLSNFFQYSIFGNNFSLHIIYSLLIYFFNAALAGKLIHQLTSQKFAALTTFSLALLMPADVEIVSWSFFTYKQYQITFLLLSLQMLVAGLQNNVEKQLIKSSILLCISSLFYEITFPLTVIYLMAAFYLRKSIWLKLTLLSFIVFYLSANFYFQNFYFLGEMRPSYHTLKNGEYFDSFIWLLDTSTTSVLNWIYNGWFLANLGFKVSFYDTVKYITFGTSFYDSLLLNILVITLWSLVLSFILLERNFLKRDFILGIFCFVILIAPLALGRSYTNGTDYLANFSMYNHVPNIFLSLTIGFLIASNHRTQFLRKNLNAVKLMTAILIIILLAFSTHSATTSYGEANARDKSITKLMKNILNEGYAITVSDDFVTRLELPHLSLNNNFNQNKYALISAEFFKEESVAAEKTDFLLDTFFFQNFVKQNLPIERIIQLNKSYSKRLSSLCTYLKKSEVAGQYNSEASEIGLFTHDCQLKLNTVTSFKFNQNTFFITRDLLQAFLSSTLTANEFFGQGKGLVLPSSNAVSHPAHHIQNLTDGDIRTTWSTIPYKSEKNVLVIVPAKGAALLNGAKLYRREIEQELFPISLQYYYFSSNGEWKKMKHKSQFIKDSNYYISSWDEVKTNFLGVEFSLRKRVESNEFMSQINEIKLSYSPHTIDK